MHQTMKELNWKAHKKCFRRWNEWKHLMSQTINESNWMNQLKN